MFMQGSRICEGPKVRQRRVIQLTYNSAFKKLRSWHLVPSLHGK